LPILNITMRVLEDEWGCAETFVNDDENGRHYREVGISMVKTGMRLYGDGNWGDGWVLLAEDRHHGDKAYYIKTEKLGKVFAVQSTFNVELETVFSKSWHEIEKFPEWNPTVKEYRILEDYSDHTRVIYHVSQEAFGGLVSSRDFVNVNCWRKIGDIYYLTGRAVEYERMPPQKGRVRGDNYIAWMKLEEAGKGRTNLVVMTAADFKGMLPKSLVDRAHGHYLLEYVRNLKKYLETGNH
jgi:hypothetical protein